MKKSIERSGGLWHAVQDLTGTSVRDVGGWLGVAVASAWFFAGHRAGGDALFPKETPLEWAARVSGWLGLDGRWAGEAGGWLSARPELFVVLLIGAVWAVGMIDDPSRTALMTPTWVALLMAVSIHPARIVFPSFLLVSAAGCLLGCVAEIREHQLSLGGLVPAAVSRIVEVPIRKWFEKPLLTVGLMAGAPLVVLVQISRQYRVDRDEDLSLAGEFAQSARMLFAGPLREEPAGQVMRFVAAALLLQRSEDHVRRHALFGLLRPGPSGAVPPRRRRPYIRDVG